MIIEALDENGLFVYIDDARKGQKYFCPCCNVPLVPCHYTSRRSHYRVESGKHKSADCQSLDKSKNIARDITYLDTKRLFRHLDRKPGPPDGGRDRGGPKSPPSHNDRTLPPADLSQLMALGGNLRDPNEKFQNSQSMHDFLVRYEDIVKYLSEDQPFGNRILELCPDSAVAGRILFVARLRENERMFFSLHVPDKSLYQMLVNQLFTVGKDSFKGWVWRKPRYKRVFVLSQWSWLKNPACKKYCIYCNPSNGKKPYGSCRSMQEGTLHRQKDIWWPQM